MFTEDGINEDKIIEDRIPEEITEEDVIQVRNIRIGEKPSKICAVLMKESAGEILAELKEALVLKPELIEWRADRFENRDSLLKVYELLKEMRNLIGEIPLIFTYRTAMEGGEADVSRNVYFAVLKFIANNCAGLVDIIDLEMFRPDAEELAKFIAEKRIYTLMLSNTIPDRTPRSKPLYNRMRNMIAQGADLARICVRAQQDNDEKNIAELDEMLKKDHFGRPCILQVHRENEKAGHESGYAESIIIFRTLRELQEK